MCQMGGRWVSASGVRVGARIYSVIGRLVLVKMGVRVKVRAKASKFLSGDLGIELSVKYRVRRTSSVRLSLPVKDPTTTRTIESQGSNHDSEHQHS